MINTLISFTQQARAAGASLPDDAFAASGLTDITDLELLLERFLVSIVAIAGAKAGAVRVLTDDGKFMRLACHLGLPAQVAIAEALVAADCGMCGVAAATDMLVWMDDMGSCARHSKQPSYFGMQCQRGLVISLLHGKDILGIYNLFFDQRVELSTEIQTMLRLIGKLLGLALHNARRESERLRLTVLKERQEMVNEVHDVIAQTLAYVKMRLPLLNAAMLAHDDANAVKYFNDVKSGVTEVHHNLREVMTYFRARMDPLGLLHAINGIANGFYDRTGIALQVKNSVLHLGLSDEQEIQVFHIVQEALANTAKHSMARQAVVAIDQTVAGLSFLVEDDGLGLATPSVSTIVAMAREMSPSNHFGMEIMRNRAQRLGGVLEVNTNERGGTQVRLLIPASILMPARQH